MTAPVAPMEARCAVCGDTGSKSQDIDGHQDCTACDAVERRAHVMGYLRELSPFMTVGSKAWVAYLFAQRQAAPVAQPALPKLPSTPEEVITFIGGNFQYMDIEGAPEDRRISLTVHDLLSAFQNLADFAEEQPAQQVEAVGQDDKSAFEAWAKGEYDLRPYNWTVKSVGGVPYDGYVRPYKTDRTVYAYEGFIAGRKCTAPQLEAQQAGDVAPADGSGKDAERLLFVTEGLDGFTNVEWDKYDYAIHFAEANGRDEPNKDDELIGLRAMIDAAIAQGRKA